VGFAKVYKAKGDAKAVSCFGLGTEGAQLVDKVSTSWFFPFKERMRKHFKFYELKHKKSPCRNGLAR